MDTAPLKRWRGYAVIVVATVALLGVLAFLASSTENSDQFARWQRVILPLNILGVAVLGVLLARRILRLVRAYRNHVPGSRLAARMATVFSALAIAPLLGIYLFALIFLSSGIDSWFKEELRTGLRNARDLSVSALDQREQERARRAVDFAGELRGVAGTALVTALEAERRADEARELAVFASDGTVLAASPAAPGARLDAALLADLLPVLDAGRAFSRIDPEGGGYVVTAAAAIGGDAGAAPRFLLTRHELARELAGLADALQQANASYSNLALAREPMKKNFLVTLTLVLMLTMFSAIFLAIRSAHRLTRPVHDLIEGTRAVGKGDFGMRLALPSHDEMGLVVQSFNEMTKRLRRASEEAERTRHLVEAERERLAGILAGLSTGVIVIDTERRLRMANAAADAILGAKLEPGSAEVLGRLRDTSPRLAEFSRQVTRLLDAGGADWQEEFPLPGDRVLRCACAPLMDAAGESGHVLVFDDITHMLHAQRDAAWSEVARRLAHEIKNPLTPIQLAAERLRRRLEGKLTPADSEVLERATHTIVQQVEGLKGMVNAFSEYARAPELKLAPVNLNELVGEVVELYRTQESRATIEVHADAALPMLLADRGRLRQVLNNLLSNALEALEGVSGGLITVATQFSSGPGGNSAVIMVTDDGHGFDKEMLARVFEPYVTSKPRGTGLGLAIVKKIAEEHGGSIEANNRPGGGAYVRVVLPVAARSEVTRPVRGMA